MKTSNHILHKTYDNCFKVQEVEGGEAKAESFLGLVLVNHLLQQLIQNSFAKGLSQNGRNMGIKNNIKETSEVCVT